MLEQVSPAATAARTPLPTITEMVAGSGVLALGVAALLPVDHIEDGPIICPFRRLTGLPCPGCGLTRSWTYLMHGRWHDALWANPFGPVLIAFVLGLAWVVVRNRVQGRPAPQLDRILRHPAAIVVWTIWLAFAVVRIGYTIA